MNIKRQDLISQLVDDYSYTKKAATSLVDDFTSVILKNLSEGNAVTIRNFGCFDIIERKARRCPHPITREPIEIPTHWTPKFFPANKMRFEVKKWEDSSKRGLL